MKQRLIHRKSAEVVGSTGERSRRRRRDARTGLTTCSIPRPGSGYPQPPYGQAGQASFEAGCMKSENGEPVGGREA